MSKNKISQLLHNRRIELNLTQKQIADYVGVTEATVSRWESGNIGNMRRDKIAKLSEVLKISPLSVMGVKEESTKASMRPVRLIKMPVRLINDYNSLNEDGKKTLIDVLTGLKLSHGNRADITGAIVKSAVTPNVLPVKDITVDIGADVAGVVKGVKRRGVLKNSKAASNDTKVAVKAKI